MITQQANPLRKHSERSAFRCAQSKDANKLLLSYLTASKSELCVELGKQSSTTFASFDFAQDAFFDAAQKPNAQDAFFNAAQNPKVQDALCMRLSVVATP